MNAHDVIDGVKSLMHLQHIGVIDESEYMDIRKRIYKLDERLHPEQAARPQLHGKPTKNQHTKGHSSLPGIPP